MLPLTVTGQLEERGHLPSPGWGGECDENMESERLSYCLLFFALVISNRGRHPLRDVMRVVRLSPPVRNLAEAVASAT